MSSRSFASASSQYLLVDASPITTIPISICGWFKATDNNPAALQCLFYYGDPASSTNYIEVTLDTGGHVTSRDRELNPGFVTGVNDVCDGGWHSFVVVFRSESAKVRQLVYVDGSAAVQSVLLSGTSVLGTATRLAWGMLRRTSGGPVQAYNGLITRGLLFQREVTSTEANEFFTTGAIADATSLVSHWVLNGAASPEPDSVGGFNLTVSGATQSSDEPTFTSTQLTSLAGTVISTTQVNLVWTNTTDGLTALELQRATDAGFTVNFTTTALAGNATTASVTGLTANTAYYWRVRIAADAYYSQPSRIRTFGTSTTLSPGAGFPAGTSTIPPTQGTGGDAGYTATVIARWDAPQRDDVTGTYWIGLKAYHIAGIKSVQFICNASSAAAIIATNQNPITGRWGYYIQVDATGAADGTVLEIRAIILPNAGVPVVLQGSDLVLGAAAATDETQTSLWLYANTNGTMQSGTQYVDSRATIAGTVASGSFRVRERLSQATSGATAILCASSPFTVSFVKGTPDNSHTWTGAISAATFTPSATPVFVGDDANAGTALAPVRTVDAAIAALIAANGASTTHGAEGCSIYLRGGVVWNSTRNGALARWLTMDNWPGDPKSAGWIASAISGNEANQTTVSVTYLKVKCGLFQDATGAVAGGWCCLGWTTANRFWICDAESSSLGNDGSSAYSNNTIVRDDDEAHMRCWWTGGTYTDHLSRPFPAGCNLTRNVAILRVGGDLWNYPGLITGNTGDDLSHPNALGIHADIVQIISTSDNWIIDENRITRQVGQGLTIGATGTTTTRVAVVNNILHSVVGNSEACGILNQGAGDHVLFWNTYIRHPVANAADFAITNLSIKGCVFGQTFNHGNASAGDMAHNHAVDATTQTVGTDWTYGDPKFVDATGLNFALAGNSPLIGRMPKVVDFDILGGLRTATTALGPTEGIASGTTNSSLSLGIGLSL